MNECLCLSVDMRSHPVETPQDWIQLLIIIADKSTETAHVIKTPCTLQLPQKQPAYRLSECSSFTPPPRLDILNLVISVRINVHIEYMYAHEHRHTNTSGAQRQVDPSYAPHEPSSNKLTGRTKTSCQRPTGYNVDTKLQQK